jgi:hypothetical protein
MFMCAQILNPVYGLLGLEQLVAWAAAAAAA